MARARSAAWLLAAGTLVASAACGVDPGVRAGGAVPAPEATTAPPSATAPDDTAPDATPDTTPDAIPDTGTGRAPTTVAPLDPATTTPADPGASTAPLVLTSVPLEQVADIGPAKPARPYDAVVAATLADLASWWDDIHPRLYGTEFEPLAGAVYPAYPGRELPGCGEPTTTYPQVAEYVAFYCASDDFLVYDDGEDSLLGELAAQYGPAIMGVVLAHEYGHAIQQRNGDIDRDLPTVYTEQQADCFAGAWVARTARGGSPYLRLSDADVRSALVAMVTVRDPVGLDQLVAGGHGSAFDRVGAFQEGFLAGPARCAGLLDRPLPLMPNEFDDPAEAATEGDLPFGYADGTIVPLIVDALESYWTFELGRLGVGASSLELRPVAPTDDVTCSGEVVQVVPAVSYCAVDGIVFLDDARARTVYDDPLEGRADFAVGYLVATGWAEAVQARLDSPLTGEARALTNDCLVGAWTLDLAPDRPARPGEGDDRGTISPGDLDEAVVAAITIGDPGFDDDVIGSAFEKIGSFRDGVLGGVDGCLARMGR